MARQQRLGLLEFSAAAGTCGYTWGQLGEAIQNTDFFDVPTGTLVVARDDDGEGLPAPIIERIYKRLFSQYPEADSIALDLSWRGRQ